MKPAKNRSQRRVILCALVTSALLLSASSISRAEEQQEFQLDQVVVTANLVATPIGKAAANVTVITREQLEKGNYSNITEALRDANGVIVSGKGFGGATQTVRLNGDDRVLVMIDGRKIGRPEGTEGRANVDISSIISLNNIERIEIVKGGASALYGSDAVGGVINIITRKGSEAKTTLDLSAGSWGERNYSLSTQGSENGLSWFVTADKKTQDYVKYNVLNPALTPGSSKGDSYRWPNSKFEGQGFTMRLDKTIDDNRSVTFNFEHWDDEGGQPFYVNPPDTAIGTHLSNNWALTYNFDQQQEVPGFARLYGNYNNQGFYGTYKSRTQGFEYQTGWKLSNQQKLIAGIDVLKSETLDNVGTDGVINYKDKSTTNSAIYLQDIYTVTNKWTVTPGVRYDHHSKFGGQTTPKFNVNYSADDTTDVYVSYNKVFKAPTLDDLYYNLPSVWGGYYGDPNLKPETGHIVSAGLNKKISERTTVSVNYFDSELTNAIDWYLNASADYVARNINKEKKHGVELDVKHKFSNKYYADLGYSYVHIEQDTGSGYFVDPINSQPNGYRLKLGYGDKQWDVNVSGQSAAGRDTDYFVDSKYWVWNMALNYKINNDTSVYVTGYNLTDKAYEIKTSVSPDYGGDLGNYPMLSRHVQMGVKYSF